MECLNTMYSFVVYDTINAILRINYLGNNHVQPVASEKMLPIRGILALFIFSAKYFYELLL